MNLYQLVFFLLKLIVGINYRIKLLPLFVINHNSEKSLNFNMLNKHLLLFIYVVVLQKYNSNIKYYTTVNIFIQIYII